MQVKELMELLAKQDPEAEVVIQDYGGEFYAGVEDAFPTGVFPWDGEAYTNAEVALVLYKTHESVAADRAFEPD